MPLMSMPRDFNVETIFGCNVRFKKDEPVYVIEDYRVIDECQKFGAVYVNPEDQKNRFDAEEDAAKHTNLPKTASERNDRIDTVLLEMQQNPEAHRHNFTSAAQPRVDFIRTAVGFDVSKEEIIAAWKNLIHPED